ncbi:hypothetical protein LCGC14_2522060, partial [marine sediment metagenome]
MRINIVETFFSCKDKRIRPKGFLNSFFQKFNCRYLSHLSNLILKP